MSKTKGLLLAAAAAAMAFTFSGCASNIVKGTYDVSNPALQIVSDNNYAKFSPDGKYIYSSDGSKFRVWNAQNGNEVFNNKTYTANAYSFSPDGKYLLTQDAKKSLKLWDLATGKDIRSFNGNEYQIVFDRFSPDGKIIVAHEVSGWTGQKISIKMWDVESGKEIRTMNPVRKQLSVLLGPNFGDFTPDGKQMLIRTWEKEPETPPVFKILDTESGEEIRKFSNSETFYFHLGFLGPDGKWIVQTAHNDFFIWDNANAVKKFNLAASIPTASKDGKYILSGSNRPPGSNYTQLYTPSSPPYYEPYIGLWDADGNKIWDKRALFSSSAILTSLDFTADMTQIRAAFQVAKGNYSHEYQIKLWDITDGREIITLDMGKHSPIIAPDGKHAVWHDEHSFSLWNIESGKAIKTFYGHDREIKSLDLSTDGNKAITSDGKVIRVWDLDTQ